MPTQLFEATNVFEPAFEFDADMTWVETHEFEITSRKVEAKGRISDYIASRPLSATVEGRVTAMPIGLATVDPQKLVSTRDALASLAAKKQIVVVLSQIFSGEMAIERAEISKSTDDGYSIMAKITLRRIETTQVATATVPASRLRTKVKRRGATGKKGGAAKGSTPSSSDGSVLVGLVDAGKINITPP